MDELSTCELPASLDALIDLTLRIDTRLADRHASRRLRDPERFREFPKPRVQTSFCTAELPDPEPMQIGRTKLSMGERQRRRDKHLCLYCGDSGHLFAKCSLKRQRPSASEGILTGVTQQPHPPTSHPSLLARISWQGIQLQVPVLLDSFYTHASLRTQRGTFRGGPKSHPTS